MTAPAKGAEWYDYQKALNEEVEAARDGQSSLLAKEQAQDSALAGHSHGEGGVVITIVANEAALGTGSTDGELKITADQYKLFSWDDENSAWVGVGGDALAAEAFIV